MHILLTDILTCPRCGPEFGLILLSQDLRERRVYEGALGCANCRTTWSVSGGFGRFAEASERLEGAEEFTTEGSEDSEKESVNREGDENRDTEAMRIAALLGVTEGPAYVLVTGPAARHAGAVADLVEDLEVIAVGEALAEQGERPGVSRMAIGEQLPFFGGRLRGVWLGGAAADRLLEEGARVVGPLGRLVLEPAPADAEGRLGAVGLRILARRDDTVVAGRTT